MNFQNYALKFILIILIDLVDAQPPPSQSLLSRLPPASLMVAPVSPSVGVAATKQQATTVKDKTSTEDDYVNDDHQKERQSVNSDKDQVAEFAYYLVEPQQAEFILDGTKGFFASGFGLSRVEQADKSRSGSVPSSVILMAQQRQQQHIRRTTTMRPVHYQIPRPQALIEPDRRFGFEEF